MTSSKNTHRYALELQNYSNKQNLPIYAHFMKLWTDSSRTK